MRFRAALFVLMISAAACRSRSPKPTPTAGGFSESDVLRPAEEWLKLEPVRLLRDYVRIDTTEEHGEQEGVAFLQRLFDCAGIETEVVCPASRRCNLLARLPGAEREGSLLLLNHVDVAPVLPQYWKDALPFEGKITQGFLYGRGAYDMKSIAMAQAIALIGLKRLGIVPRRDILFLGEADEEMGQRFGSKWLLEKRPEWFRGVGAVLNEGGTNEMILREVRYWGLETVQAGYGLIEFEAASAAPLEEISRRFPRIESAPVVPLPQVVEGFGLMANHLPNPLTDPLRHLDRVRLDSKELAALPDRYGAFLQARIHWSVPYGYPPGKTTTMRRYVIVSTPPGLSPDPYLDSIRAAATEAGLRVTEQESSGATTASPYPTPFTNMLRRITEILRPGAPFGPMPMFGGWTTSNYFRRQRIPAYGFSPIGANITDESRRHGQDERIYLRDYIEGVDLYRQVLIEFAFL